MTAEATPARSERVRLGVADRTVTLHLSRDSQDGWAVEHKGEQLGLVYALASMSGGPHWRARPRGRPASAVTYGTRANALVALYLAVRG